MDIHSSRVYDADFSPHTPTLAVGTSVRSVLLVNPATGTVIKQLKHHSSNVYTVAWAPNGEILASGGKDEAIVLWQVAKQKIYKRLLKHSGQINALAWSPDGTRLASNSDDSTVCIWELGSKKPLRTISTTQLETCLAWSPDGQLIASAGDGNTIRLWDSTSGRLVKILEAHFGWVTSISFSSNGQLLASKSLDNTVRLWNCGSWETVSILEENSSEATFAGLAFHPSGPFLATLAETGTAVRIWELDYKAIARGTQPVRSVHYKNAKVVLLGDTGVGKTGLSLVLTGQPWKETGSTHGRFVWTFEKNEVTVKGQTETHEILLWDLAGQPDYRVIHQLHLAEVAIALLVCDSRNQNDPFFGVRYWARALRQTELIEDGSATPMLKLLVAARTDVGRIGMTAAQLNVLSKEFGTSGFFETSAKEGWGIEDLASAIRNGIDWESLPSVSSTELFHDIKQYLIEEKKAGRVLSTATDLYRAYLKVATDLSDSVKVQAEFDTCIKQIETSGLIRRLSFGDLVLLQPELLDTYASAMVNAAKSESDGLGCISEELTRSGELPIPQSARIKNTKQESLLILSTIEELLSHEIALREQGEADQYLVFPSQLTRENPNEESLAKGSVVLSFEGPVMTIYATVVVRLSRSSVFAKKELWKNVAIYTAKVGGDCGIALRELDEGAGELTLFFQEETSEETRFQFEDFVHVHLKRRAIPNSVQRRRIFVCSKCNTPITELAASRRRERGLDWIACNVCDQRLSLLDLKERLSVSSKTSEMDSHADSTRQRETAATVLDGKIETRDFDVFLCHNGADKAEVKQIALQLRARGILPWLDEWELQPGRTWQTELEKQIASIKSSAVFLGREGIGPWQEQEVSAFLREFVTRRAPVIPVILPTASTTPTLPIFLRGITWVDFRKQDPDPFETLIWGITGKRHRN